MDARLDISNMAHLTEFFNDLSLFDQRKIFLEAFRKASKPLVERIKAGTPVDRGNLLRSIGTKAVPNEIAILVGAMRPRGSHGHLIESGTAERVYISKKGKPHRTGRIVGIQFVEKAYDAGTEEEVLDAIEEQYYIAIDNAIMKINKKLDK
jgi:hypothetical protein